MSLNHKDPDETKLMFDAIIGDTAADGKSKKRLADKLSSLVLWERNHKYYRLMQHLPGDLLAVAVSVEDPFPMPALVLPADELDRIGYCRSCGRTADELEIKATGALIEHYETCSGDTE